MFRMHFTPGLIVAVCIGKFIRSGSGTGASFMNMKSVKAEALPCIVRSKAGNISTDAKRMFFYDISSNSSKIFSLLSSNRSPLLYLKYLSQSYSFRYWML